MYPEDRIDFEDVGNEQGINQNNVFANNTSDPFHKILLLSSRINVDI